jgi:DNA-binding NarL/FixJ family response regulator
VVLSTQHPANRSLVAVVDRARPRIEPARPPRDPSRPVRVVVADDSYLIREGLRQVLSGIDAIHLQAAVADGTALLAAVEADPPDVVICDIRMPPSGRDEGLQVARRLRATHPGIGVILLSHDAGATDGLALLDDGAEGRGYLHKERVHDRHELLAAIEMVAQGGTIMDPTLVQEILTADRRRRTSRLTQLTPRELEVLGEMAQGRSNSAIAESLTLTKRAVEKHVGSILQKLCEEDEALISRRVSAVLVYLSEVAA